MSEEQSQKEWYTNKEIYEMMVELSKGLEKTNSELGKTQVLIRDYNGLREKIENCEKRLDKGEGQARGEEKQVQKTEQKVQFEWEKMGYIIGVLGVVIAGISIVVK